MNLYYMILAGFYTTGFAMAPILSNRMVDIYGIHVLLGAIVTSLVCSVLDVINNNYGLQKAKETVLSALVVRLLIYVMISLLAMLPVLKEANGFEEIVLTALRMIFASELASFVSQYFVDIRIFDKLRNMKQGFAIRYNLSNLLSSAIHSVLFVTIALIGTKKQELIPTLIIGSYVSKTVIQIIMTPVFSLLTKIKPT